MDITINKKTFELKYNFRIFYVYENIMNKSFDYSNVTLSDIVDLFYCAVVARQQANGYKMITFTDFQNWLDENDGDKLLAEFSNWLAYNMRAQAGLSEEFKGAEEDKNTVETTEKN